MVIFKTLISFMFLLSVKRQCTYTHDYIHTYYISLVPAKTGHTQFTVGCKIGSVTNSTRTSGSIHTGCVQWTRTRPGQEKKTCAGKSLLSSLATVQPCTVRLARPVCFDPWFLWLCKPCFSRQSRSRDWTPLVMFHTSFLSFQYGRRKTHRFREDQVV